MRLPTGTQGEKGNKHEGGVPPPMVDRLGASEESKDKKIVITTLPQWCACTDLLVTRDFTVSPGVKMAKSRLNMELKRQRQRTAAEA